MEEMKNTDKEFPGIASNTPDPTKLPRLYYHEVIKCVISLDNKGSCEGVQSIN